VGGSVSNISFVNQGRIVADVSGRTIAIQGTTLTNHGTIEANGGTLTVSPSNSSNYLVNGSLDASGSIWRADLLGGTWRVGPASTMRLLHNGITNRPVQIVNLAATVELSGLGSNLFGGGSFDALSGLASVAPAGELTIRNGRNFAALPSFQSQGKLIVEPGSQFRLLRTKLSSQISLWSGEGNATDSVDGNSGTLVNGTTFAAGQVGQAFSFDGVNDIVTTPLVMTYSAGATYSAWIRTTDTAGMLIAGGGGVATSTTRGMGLFVASGGRLQAFGSRGTTSFNFNLLGPVVNNGQWRHVAVTWTGTTAANGVKLYVDGALVGSTTALSAGSTDTHPLNFGEHTNLTYPAYAGLIDEIGAYYGALSQTEIQFLMNGGQSSTYSQAAGVTTVNGSLSADSVAITGGRLQGIGTVTANVSNTGGTVTPGNSPGILDILGKLYARSRRNAAVRARRARSGRSTVRSVARHGHRHAGRHGQGGVVGRLRAVARGYV
jgi:hypothetical protein